MTVLLGRVVVAVRDTVKVVLGMVEVREMVIREVKVVERVKVLVVMEREVVVVWLILVVVTL